jgi:hypothetical protein
VRRGVAVALVLAGCSGIAACGGSGEPRKNVNRPPAPVTLTAAVHDRFVQVSPAAVGAGPVNVVVSNQTRRPQIVTFETSNIPGNGKVGRRASTGRIAPRGTGRLSIDARQGDYMIHVGDRTVQVAHVKVGPRRESSQNDLLLP